jgi:alginate O-acetyltransferase complex protein AlgJ
MKKNLFLILIFSLILVLPTLDSIFHFSPVKELFEKRLPVEKPKFPENFSEAKTFPKKFENFFNDNYGFRKTLIAFNSDNMDDIFAESPDSRAVIGKDGWLYFDNDNSILDATGKAALSDELIDRGVEAFAKNWQEMRAKNINYLLVIAADKTSIYPEFLPNYIKPSADGTHRIDKFLAALKKKYPNFPVLDLRVILKKAKEKEIIYQQTDTHWNRRGAHYAYVEIMKNLAATDGKNFNFTPHLRKDFKDKADQLIRGDISDIMNSDARNLNYELEPKFKLNARQIETSKEEKSQFHNPIFFTNSNKNLPRLFVYNDSYFGDLFFYVMEHFSNGYFVNEHPCDLDYGIIKNFHPNVVIQEFWEGRIEIILSQCK